MIRRSLFCAAALLASTVSAANPLDELQAQTEAMFQQYEQPAPMAMPGRGFIALLLPLSGQFAASGEAVRDGFLTAATASGMDVRVYDSGTDPQAALTAYYAALRDGATALVGPLRREALAQLAAQGVSLPWLALNYGEGTGPQTLQLGLSPEDEGRSAADQAVSRGLRRALTLTARTDWADRAQKAFALRLQELGGQVLGTATYETGAVNYSETLQQLLGLKSSEARNRALNDTLGQRTQFEPRRREDVDFIFLVARPQDGRLIWPQLRFYRAGDLPVYATSLIYEGRADNELNGIHLCDMPFLLQGEGDWAALRAESQALLPSLRSQPRLFALGYDAYAIIERLRSGDMATLNGNEGAVGRFLLQGSQVQRQLACVMFRDGLPR